MLGYKVYNMRRTITENISPKEHRINLHMTKSAAYWQSRLPGLSSTHLRELKDRTLDSAPPPLYHFLTSFQQPLPGRHLQRNGASVGRASQEEPQRLTTSEPLRHISFPSTGNQFPLGNMLDIQKNYEMETPTAVLEKRNNLATFSR